ncbi:glycoside hydrolase family 30 protein [Flavobacterium muglaense]|uniref:Glycoside hydrolase family 30 protein n=1 Tax=Flavobacterium muglaense TaxID=2764716 RepID=A0A923N1Z8_9FLAO|nr:glycoside hydrolase family 30 protein [Flavobacterium muglaense]MBC5839077.1 glycoside hydrolase family 30 protein [Flavobacterium muglaense]MBC5845552.1 glycoside hydrolase family 30 protein [Flavobacterium muglaense]
MKITPIATLLMISSFAFSQQKKVVESNSFLTKNKSIAVYTTADSTNLRLTKTDVLSFVPSKQPLEVEVSVFVAPDKTYQKFMGIGGAITDASAEVFAKLPKDKQNELMNAYYDKEKGIGYSLLRTTIHSSDFSTGSYTYIKEGDKDLTTFSIEHDRQYRIPMIKEAIKTAGGSLLLYASPWSPPAFMKNTNNMLKGGVLLPEFYQTWASYYVKFIKAYEKEGMPIWGLTIQNEPMATQVWESCIYSAEAERDFLKNFLGPTLKKEGLGDKKIVVWDHNRDLMGNRANTIFSDPEASKYAWGIGFHWYENWSGGSPMFENVRKVQEAFPSKNILFTEGCVEKFDAQKYQFWANGERYGTSMINDFNNGTVGWTDWNILLDQNGGPNHVGNFCFAPIHANTDTGDLIYTPSYYYIGHFSKFIRKDARRVSSSVSRSDLLSTSFLNVDGKVVTVVMNQTNKKVTYNLIIGAERSVVVIPAHAIQTLVY